MVEENVFNHSQATATDITLIQITKMKQTWTLPRLRFLQILIVLLAAHELIDTWWSHNVVGDLYRWWYHHCMIIVTTNMHYPLRPNSSNTTWRSLTGNHCVDEGKSPPYHSNRCPTKLQKETSRNFVFHLLHAWFLLECSKKMNLCGYNLGMQDWSSFLCIHKRISCNKHASHPNATQKASQFI